VCITGNWATPIYIYIYINICIYRCCQVIRRGSLLPVGFDETNMEKQGGREGGREGRKEGGREGGREGGKEGEWKEGGV
jgi:hypothetical protein